MPTQSDLPRITVCGNQGLWSVFVAGYGDVGVVANIWKDGDRYEDPGLYQGCPHNTKANKLADLIKSQGLAVTARFVLDGDPHHPDTKWKRDEYIALWQVTDVVLDKTSLRFRFVGEPLADIGKKNKWQDQKKRTRRGVGSY